MGIVVGLGVLAACLIIAGVGLIVVARRRERRRILRRIGRVRELYDR